MRIKKIWLTIILLCCSILFFVACKEERLANSISLNGYSSETPLELTIGKFTYSDYTVSVIYDNGEKEELTLTEDMIPETDKLKFYHEGRNTITITYKGAETSVAINVARNKFSDTIRLNVPNQPQIYNGKPLVIEVEGDIPGGTEIIYPQGNSFQNAGSYDMTAILQCDGYESKILSARVVIEKATYDITNAQLYNETVVYDKDAHGLTIKGKPTGDSDSIIHSPATLPQGVSVSYYITKVKDAKGTNIPTEKQQLVEGNKAVDSGTYKVCARFKGDISNYHAIPDSVAYLTIERATYDMSKIEFADVTATYSGKAHGVSIAADSKLPTGVVVSYQIKQLKDGVGELVSDSYKDGNTAVNSGEYAIKAIFSLNGKNTENYTTVPMEKEARLTILRASYDEAMQNVYINSEYDVFATGKTYEMTFDCPLPEGVSPQFTLTNENGETVEGRIEKTESVDGNETAVKTTYKYLFEVESAGEYTCVVSFTHNHEHYKEISLRLTAWIIISSNV